MQFDLFSNKIIKIKHLELLGELSHNKLSPPYRLDLAKQMKDKIKFAKQAGVLILFYPDHNQNTNVAFILRKTYKGVHSAQIGFPGGKYENQDINLEHTALRETEEEIGVSKKTIKTLCAISPIYIPPSNFMVHPYVGLLSEFPSFVKQDEEVEAIIEILLDDILNDNNIIETPVDTSYNIKVKVPAFSLNGYSVWGATAMILSELKDLLKQIL